MEAFGRRSGDRYQTISYIITGIVVLFGVATRFHGWHDRLYAIAFYVGFIGMAFLFLQWRNHGDLFARNWCLGAFGTWFVAAIVGMGSIFAAQIIAGVALSVGLGGAITALIRSRRKSQAATAAECDPTGP